MNSSVITPLENLKNKLSAIADKGKDSYAVPNTWSPVGIEAGDGESKVNPADFFLSHIDAIESNQISGVDPLKSLNGQIPGGTGGSWISDEVIYNLFVRLTTAYDHDGDGELGGNKTDITLNDTGVRESGTFLKSIALLGHIKALGATVIHLLPVTLIGKDGNKGELGSPYAIKNPYKLEETQADPLIDMSVEEQFKAFVQACHMLGIRVIIEFVFRTASKDSEWITKHPDWFYWIDNTIVDREPGEKNLEIAASQYGNPVFAQDVLDVINHKVDTHDFTDMPLPPKEYRDFFVLPPNTDDISENTKGQLIAKARKETTGELIDARIPGAFADWPPDDNQPPWGDVTYLRMFLDEDMASPKFNYIAYNTIRMYDTELAKSENATRSLWDTIRDLIPSYQEKFGIDGVMVDMGHAVPVALMQEIISKAREIDPNFAFLSENFEITQESVDAGYNAVIGYAWWVEYKKDGMYDLLDHVGNRGIPLSFFGAVENHNTPRAAARENGLGYSKYAFLVNSMLPGSIPFIHSGQELGEVAPINTGLDFTSEDMEKLKGHKLALFDLNSYNWKQKSNMTDYIKNVLQVRREFSKAICNPSTETFGQLETGHDDVICFLRNFEDQHVLVLFNRSVDKVLAGRIDLSWCISGDVSELKNRVKDEEITINNGNIQYGLSPTGSILLAW